MSHNSIDKPLITLKGNVLTSGGAGKLAKGQMAIVSTQNVSGGLKALSDFAGLPKNTPIKIRVGRNQLPSGLKSTYAPKFETSWFTPESIVSIKANFPKFTEQKFDELIVGYDGVSASTALNIPEGKSSVIDITVHGAPIEILAGTKEHTIKMHFGREEGQTTQEVVQKLVARLQEYKLPRSQKPLKEFLEIGVIDSENVALTGVPYVFSTLTITDNGDSNDLADIQAQYPSYTVARTARNKKVSTYTLLHPESVTLADYVLRENSSYVKGCTDCLAGYSAIDGGVVYHVTLEDDGVTQVALVDDLPGYVSGTVLRVGSVNGKGVYSVVVDNDLTDAEIASFIATNAISSTAEIKKIGSVATVCEDANTTNFTWVEGETCYADLEQYNIQLKDTDCGETRLAELQSAYPSLNIVEGVATGVATQTVTISGGAGDAVITVGTSNYTTAYITSPTATASAFVVAHAADILADYGATVTSAGAVLTFSAPVATFPTIVGVAGGLTETVGAITYSAEALAGGCQRNYSATVVTNLVCDECAVDFLQPFTSQAPEPFELHPWTKTATVFNENSLMGIKLKGKSFEITPTEVTRDQIPFYETSTMIKSVAGGYREMDYENFDPAYTPDELFKVTRLERAQDRDALGVNFFPLEEVSRAHYLGEMREKNNLFAKFNLGEESLIDFKSQYITYDVTWQDTGLSQAAGGRSNITHTEKIVVEFGYHDNIETLLNRLASKAGVEVVAPTAN